MTAFGEHDGRVGARRRRGTERSDGMPDDPDLAQMAANLRRHADPVVPAVESSDVAPEAASDDITFRGFGGTGGPQDDGLAVQFSAPE